MKWENHTGNTVAVWQAPGWHKWYERWSDEQGTQLYEEFLEPAHPISERWPVLLYLSFEDRWFVYCIPDLGTVGFSYGHRAKPTLIRFHPNRIKSIDWWFTSRCFF